MQIDIYLDDAAEPLESITPPESFRIDTANIPDGRHELRFVATDDDGVTGERSISVDVRNGPAIAVHGIADGDTVKGEVSVLANAYGAKGGDAFDARRIETPAPIPTWAWLLFLCVISWGAGYIALDLQGRDALSFVAQAAEATEMPAADAETESTPSWAELGERVYGNRCAACHRPEGTGVTGVFPPLAGNPAVLDPDATDHILAITDGVSGKVIDGVAYSGPMPAFGETLSDEEIAAVVNHERSQWGNDAPLVNVTDVERLRN